MNTQRDWIWRDGKYHHHIVVDQDTPKLLRLVGLPAKRKAHYVDGTFDHYEYEQPSQEVEASEMQTQPNKGQINDTED